METESVENYLKRGKTIKQYRSRADEIAATQIPRGKYYQHDAYIAALQASKKTWQLKKNARRKQSSKPVTRRTDRAGQSSKSRPN